MGDLFQPTHLLVIAVVLLVLFGGKKLPELGKGLGEGLKGFREGLKGTTESAPPAPPTASSVQQNVAPTAPPSTPNETK
jgi:sec-independent protein translocase protein TatA